MSLRGAITAVSSIFLTGIICAGQNLRMETLSVTEGLSSNMVYDLIQDSDGYMWMATDVGLDRYDGKSFRNFYSRGRVNCLLETSDNTILLGTENGIMSYDRSSAGIVPFSLTASIAEENIRVITQRGGELWVGTNHGLYMFSTEAESVLHWTMDGGGLRSDIIRVIHPDGHFLFVGTFDGVSRLDLDTESWDYVSLKPSYVTKPENNLVLSIIQSPSDPRKLLVGTQTGLCELDKSTLDFKVYDRSHYPSMSNNTVKTMFPTESGAVWMGTEEGLMYFDGIDFQSYRYDPSDMYSLPNNIVWKVMYDDAGVFWAATGSGVSKANMLVPSFSVYDISGFGDSSLSGLEILGACFDHGGRVWTGTRKGLSVLDMDASTVSWTAIPNAAEGTYNFTQGLYIDCNDILWVGTSEGLLCVDLKSDRVIPVQPSLSHLVKYIHTVSVLENGDICVGGGNGQVQVISYEFDPLTRSITSLSDRFFEFDRRVGHMAVMGNMIWLADAGDGLSSYNIWTGEKTFYRHSDDPYSISSDVVHSLYSASGTLWVGTSTGLDRYDAQKDHFDRVSAREEINGVYSLAGDDDGRIWFASAGSIGYYYTSGGVFKFFSTEKWVGPRNSILEVSAARDGNVYFFGKDKALRVSGDDVPSRHVSAPLRLSDVRVLGESRPVDTRQVIRLRHGENMIAFDVAMLSYASPETITYRYRMDGVDKDWRRLDNLSSSIEYPFLNSGRYTLTVRAVDGEGIPALNALRLSIVVASPHWRSWWACILYLLALSVLSTYILMNRRRHMDSQAELQKEIREREKIEGVNKLKNQFFANVTHDFRTPITLILSPVETLLNEETDPSRRDKLEIVRQNGYRLLKLVNQILDFKKVEQCTERGKQSGDLVRTVEGISCTFSELAKKKGLSLHFESSEKHLIMDFDPDSIDKIMVNLIANAIKYTPDGGQVLVRVNRKCDAEVELSVSDTGIGIPESDIPMIFGRYYRVEDHKDMQISGEGLGLSIVKELVEQHNGRIEVESPGIGTTFTVILPVIGEKEYLTTQEDLDRAFESPSVSSSPEAKSDTILIVEDNPDMRSYLSGELGLRYTVLAVPDAETALKLVPDALPDVVVSDVMLPGMSGVELCRRIKSDSSLNHIPVMLLSALSEEDSVVSGFNAGADGYISKPFSMRVLVSRLDNILTQRSALRDNLKKSTIDLSGIGQEAPDTIFIKRLVSVIEENISDPNLDVPYLCDQFSMTHVSFYRKVKAITGYNVNNFIREVRIKKAAQLLTMSGYSVSEIMYEVGFNHRSYFAKCFKEVMGMSPKEYAKLHNSAGNFNDL